MWRSYVRRVWWGGANFNGWEGLAIPSPPCTRPCLGARSWYRSITAAAATRHAGRVNSGPTVRSGNILLCCAARVTTAITINGVVRNCASSSETKCEKVSDKSYPGLRAAKTNGEVCFCTSDGCNSAPRGVPTGHLMVIFIGVVCLLALTTQRWPPRLATNQLSGLHS